MSAARFRAMWVAAAAAGLEVATGTGLVVCRLGRHQRCAGFEASPVNDIRDIVRSPFEVFAISLVVLSLSAWSGAFLFRKVRTLNDDEREDFSIIQTATLTLLALIIGFSFSMAINRYDVRRNYEEGEANAIGTEYVRADLLPVAEAAKVRGLLRQYLDQRLLFYSDVDAHQLQRINSYTAQLQADLWAAVHAPAMANPTPVMALAVSGMNDVLNSQGYTQAAYWNRIPIGEWGLMAVIAIFASVLVGYGSRRAERDWLLLLLLPAILSVSFMLISDIDSPRGGLIHIRPLNLESLAQSLHEH